MLGAQDPDAFTISLEGEQQELRDKLTAATTRLKQVHSLTSLIGRLMLVFWRGSVITGFHFMCIRVHISACHECKD